MAENEVEIIIRAEDLASGSFSRINKEAEKLTTRLNKASQSLSSMGLAARKPVAEISRLSRAVSSFDQKITRLRPKLTGVFRGVVGVVGRVRRAVFSLTSAFVLLGGTLVFRSLIKTSQAFEDLRTQLDALQGSSRAGEAAVEWIKQFAKDTPLSIEEVTRAFVRAKALGLDPMSGTLQSLVDVNSKLAGSGEKLLSITRAVGEMYTKSTIQAQEMTLQLTNTGVPAWDLLAKAMNRANGTTEFTIKSLRKLSEQGKLGRKEVLLLIDEMGRFGAGAAIANMTKFSGIWSNFKDQIALGADEFTRAKEGLFDFTKALLSEGITSLEEFRSRGDLSKWGKGFGFTMLNASRALLELSIAAVKIGEVFIWLATPLTNAVGFFLLIGTIAKDAIDSIIGSATRLKRTFAGEIGDAFNPKPVDNLTSSLEKALEKLDAVEARMRGATQKRLDQEIANKAQTASQEAQSKSPDTGGSRPTGANGGLSFGEINKLRVLSEENTLQEIQNSSNEFMALADEVDFAHKQGQLDRQAEFNSQFNQLMQDGSIFRQDLAREEARVAEQLEAQKKEAALSGFSAAVNIANALFIFQGQNSKKMFAVVKGLNIAMATIDAYGAFNKVLNDPTIVSPALRFSLAASALSRGLVSVARISATSLSSGGGGSGGVGGGGGSGSTPLIGANPAGPSEFPNGNQGQTINIEIKTNDARSFLDNAREIKQEIAEMVADVAGNNGNTGQFQIAVERN